MRCGTAMPKKAKAQEPWLAPLADRLGKQKEEREKQFLYPVPPWHQENSAFKAAQSLPTPPLPPGQSAPPRWPWQTTTTDEQTLEKSAELRLKRQDLGLISTEFEPTRHTHVVAGRPVQAISRKQTSTR